LCYSVPRNLPFDCRLMFRIFFFWQAEFAFVDTMYVHLSVIAEFNCKFSFLK
jgi:hypothetical protein